ncbi:MAG TPA: DUF5666 domain-containing protein [Burkholderiaceae bacterium]|nr:DUF5666 domain-containing protein [Burkholderiaceae bacterium]
MHARQGNPWLRGLLCALAALLIAAGCGGVDSGGTGAVVSVGPIDGFGSIIVNGVRFDDSTATIEDDDGAMLTPDRLLLGVITRVQASAPVGPAGSQTATAQSIRISSDLLGPVTSIDAASATMVVLGQTVVVTPATAFDATLTGGLASVTVGSTVEVYGRFDAANSRYTATRIEVSANPAYYRLRGPVASVDSANLRLTIGGESIDYSGVAPSDLANVVVGDIVRAKLQTGRQSGNWLAVALPSGVLPLPDGAAEIEGRISAFTSSQQFSVDGTPVDATMATFPDGTSGVALGERVSVEGTSNAGVLHASKVSVEGDESAGNSHFELHGAIDTLDTVAMTFMLRGLTVDYSGSVQYAGGTAADLAVGRRVEVTGTLSGTGTGIKAQEIDFDN